MERNNRGRNEKNGYGKQERGKAGEPGKRGYGRETGRGREERHTPSGRGGRDEKRGSYSHGERPPRGNGEMRPLRDKRETPAEEPSANILYGRNPVMEALKNNRDMEKLVLQNGLEGSAKVIEAIAREKNLRIQYAEKSELDRLANGGSHQGVIAFTSPYKYYELEDLLEEGEASERDPLIVILDGLEDPHNLGAILRSCDCVGATGVVIPRNRSVSLTESAAKASAGAAEYVKVAKVTNLSQTLDELKERGYWTAACDMDGEPFTRTNLTGPMAVVIGGEGQGVSRLMREKCDFIVSIPMRGHVNSLNASNAAAVLLYEIDRQRRAGEESR